MPNVFTSAPDSTLPSSHRLPCALPFVCQSRACSALHFRLVSYLLAAAATTAAGRYSTCYVRVLANPRTACNSARRRRRPVRIRSDSELTGSSLNHRRTVSCRSRKADPLVYCWVPVSESGFTDVCTGRTNVTRRIAEKADARTEPCLPPVDLLLLPPCDPC